MHILTALLISARKVRLPALFAAMAILISSFAGARAESSAEPRVLSLAGAWDFSLGTPEPTFPQGPLPKFVYTDSLALPGTTETRGKGPENNDRETGMLTRLHKFGGAAWFGRDVEIPASWAGKRVILTLERTKYTQVWLDAQPCASQLVHGAPQEYDLSHLATQGRHRLTLMVDNRAERRSLQVDVHQYSDNTQTNWNGVIGRVELAATDLVWIDDVQAYPDFAKRSFNVRVTLGNRTGRQITGNLRVNAKSFNHAEAPHQPAPVTHEFAAEATSSTIEIEYPLGNDAKLWDEFSPNLYRLVVGFHAGDFSGERTIETGLREFKTKGGQFNINGLTTFLRGKHDACVFPLTGHPPMDVEGWVKYLSVLKDYGLNHVRCHTWIPPEAAFAAADRLGIYLQPELPFWGSFDARARDALTPEADALLRNYGNHPCFVMMTLGNEIYGDRAMMNALVVRLRSLDPRHLYSDGSNNYLWEPRLQSTNDFWPTAKTITPASNNRPVVARGSFCNLDGYEGHTQWGQAETRTDLSVANSGIPVPVIGHETGQWTVYPDYREITKYTGVTRARNLEAFRAALEKHGMLDQNLAFTRASGALAVSLYKEENELALRTPGFGGFQLLDLQDFPGQGTALVGLLDAFMDSKGLVTPGVWRQSCSPVVPLARFDHYTWTTADIYTADIELAHYGSADLPGAVVSWAITGTDGKILAQQSFAPTDLCQGGLRKLGRVEASLEKAASPARYTLEVSVTCGAQHFANSWPLWVYPVKPDTTPQKNVAIVRAFNAEARKRLASGEHVVLIPDGKLLGNVVGGTYPTDYWCWPMFHNSPGTMGLLCDPKHPALALFPTASNTERQWTPIVQASTPVILARTPASFRPIVQVIDNLERNEKLGLVFEAKVGPGSLLVCAVDLYSLQARPEARQLLASLLAYAASTQFAPQQELQEALLDTLLSPSLAQGRTVTATSIFQPSWGPSPSPDKAVDGDINTAWASREEEKTPALTVDLGRVCAINAVELLWEYDEPGYFYLIETSTDAKTWNLLSDQRRNTYSGGRHFIATKTESARFIKLTTTGCPTGRRFSLRDWRVLGE